MAADGAAVVHAGGGSDRASSTDQVRQAALLAERVGAPIIQSLVLDSAGNEREVAVAVPVAPAAEANPRYVLVGEISGRRLASGVGITSAGGDAAAVAVFDQTGMPLVRSPGAEQYISALDRFSFSNATGNRKDGLLSDKVMLLPAPRRTEAMIRAFSIAPVTGYIVVVALPAHLFSGTVEREVLSGLIVAAVLLTGGLIAALYFARRLVRGLQFAHDGRPGPAISSGLREVDALATSFRDLATARDASQTSLLASEGRVRDLVTTLDLAAIMGREIGGKIVFWSQGCVRMYGWSRDEAVGRSSHELLETQFPIPLHEVEETLLATGEWKGDLVHRRRDGSRIIVAAHKALGHDAERRVHMVMESLIDVTPLREAEDALRRLNQELEQRVQTEVAAREAAQRRAEHADRIKALGQLAGGIAHDFNNVLQAIAGGAALIARRPDAAENVARLVRIISDSAARGASITRRMLLLARRGVLQAEPIDATSLLEGMREILTYTLGGDIDVQVEVAPGLPRLLSDKAQLETALVNLATNARDAMPSGGLLRLIAEPETVEENRAAPHPAGLMPGRYVRLSVVDTGTGMPLATLERVGEPFFTTKDVGKGSGLGLPMVKGFVDQSGGAFGIESEVGVGTTARLWLPVAADESPLRRGTEGDKPRSRPTGCILLVDDDTLVRDTLMEQLEELGHKVLTASCGTDALAILRAREAVNLMITDLSMPGMSGLALIKEAQGLRPSLPAILLTGYPGDATMMDKDLTSRRSYTLLRKPATTAALNVRVTTLLERT